MLSHEGRQELLATHTATEAPSASRSTLAPRSTSSWESPFRTTKAGLLESGDVAKAWQTSRERYLAARGKKTEAQASRSVGSHQRAARACLMAGENSASAGRRDEAAEAYEQAAEDWIADS